MIKGNPVGWFDIYVANLEKAKEFYEQVFEVQLIELPIEWGKQALFPFNPQSPNISGAIVEKQGWEPGPSNTIVYFETEDCSLLEAKIENAGGKVIQPKMNIGEFGFVSIFLDSEGNTLGLHSRN
ncbi:VOC family protein [Algoriphagus confluentis]|uniref:VOC family protein n=2 Tax=Algoriphagus confluentis TaxID=1697556 RepID=A0ABQ6PU85_9BACT|nr:VOC family protein [Algoriphagus confluentis]